MKSKHPVLIVFRVVTGDTEATTQILLSRSLPLNIKCL